MLSDKPIKQIPLDFKGKRLFIDEDNFKCLQKNRSECIADENCRPFSGATMIRQHSLAEAGIELIEGGRVLPQELTNVVSPWSADDFLLRSKIGDDWFEWE